MSSIPSITLRCLAFGEEGPTERTFRCDYWDLLPPLTPEEREALKASIVTHRLKTPIITATISEAEQLFLVIDGWHRLSIAAELELAADDVPQEVIGDVEDYEQEQLDTLAEELNLKRRHMTAEQRQEWAVKLRQQGKSLRQISDQMGVPKSTVARDLSTVPLGTVELPTTITGDDGKERLAKMPPRPSPSEEPPRLSNLTPQERSEQSGPGLFDWMEDHQAAQKDPLALEGGTAPAPSKASAETLPPSELSTDEETPPKPKTSPPLMDKCGYGNPPCPRFSYLNGRCTVHVNEPEEQTPPSMPAEQKPRLHRLLRDLESVQFTRGWSVMIEIPKHKHLRSLSLALSLLPDAEVTCRTGEDSDEKAAFIFSDAIFHQVLCTLISKPPREEPLLMAQEPPAPKEEGATPTKKGKRVLVECPACNGGARKLSGGCLACHGKGVIEAFLVPSESSGNGSYQGYNSPPSLIAAVRQVGKIGLDPCHNKDSMWEARETIDEDQDSLSSLWAWAEMAHGEIIPINPPWSNMLPFVDKTLTEVTRGAQIVLIGPAGNPSSEWWQKAARNCVMRCDLSTRVRYYKEGVEDPNPRDSTVLFYWGNQAARFAAVFGPLGVLSERVKEETYATAAEALRAEQLHGKQRALPGLATPSVALKDAEPDAVGPWANRALTQLGACLTREEFDQAYTRLEALASSLDERNELLAAREELRGKLPSQHNVKPEDLVKKEGTQRGRCHYCVLLNDCELRGNKLVCAGCILTHEAKAAVKAAPKTEATKGPELLYFEVWLKPHSDLTTKGGYSLFEDEAREVSLTPKQFASWQKDPRLRFRTCDWREQMAADLKLCNTVNEGNKVFHAAMELAVTGEEREQVRVMLGEWKRTKPATKSYNHKDKAPAPKRNKGRNEEPLPKKKARVR